MTIRIYLVTRKLIDLPKVTAQVDKKTTTKYVVVIIVNSSCINIIC